MGKGLRRRLLVVRSGPTDWDLVGRLQGQTDLPLAESAQAQVLQMLRGVDLTDLSAVYFGPDEASRVCGEALVEAADVKGHAEEDLRDLGLGLWTGLRIDELETRFERAGTRWLEDPASVAIPEGEAFSELEARIMNVIGRVLVKKRNALSVAVVLRPIAHAMVISRLEGTGTTSMGRLLGAWDTVGPMWFEVIRGDPRLQPVAAPPTSAADQVRALPPGSNGTAASAGKTTGQAVPGQDVPGQRLASPEASGRVSAA